MNVHNSYDMGLNRQPGVDAHRTVSSSLSQANYTNYSGHNGGRPSRCTDRFIQYPYPKCVNTFYQKEYHQKLQKGHLTDKKDAFNLEKETKIINPHNMELSTTNKVRQNNN